ncbi:lysylphosphatidylglycerol synthase domain-containing protein [uncultured Algibacter sp.]|uniref:lysylphosphatidylglycerol synthase domain-containing protein n=1 Tax=uncultured Algibacter sp. TaxID=298659 RepID=UPI00260A9076|nr:lysylphosphatidylglycerol synthase domain-containing protein [uncultured Algibacter sp.]
MAALTLSYKTNQLFFKLIKIGIVIIAFYFIYYKLVNNDEITLPELINIITSHNILSLKNSLILLLLTSINWLLEIVKWKTLINPIKKICFKEALEQSLGSLTASIFTPNRIGEYGAKALYYKSNFRKPVLLVNLISNLLQLTVTIGLGCIGLSFFLLKHNLVSTNYIKLISYMLIILVAIIIAVLISIKSKFILKRFSAKKLKQFIISYPKSIIAKGLFYSFGRYMTFSFQFYVLLQLFQIYIGYFEAMTVITGMYLIASVIPSIFIFDIVIKGSVAVYLFSFLAINELIILSITTIMWVLNFVLPSIIGSYFVLNFKLVKNTES